MGCRVAAIILAVLAAFTPPVPAAIPTTAPTAAADSEDAARAVVERAIVAQGGVARFAVRRLELRGTIVLAPGQGPVPVSIVKTRTLDTYSTELRFEEAGKAVVQLQSLDSDGARIEVNGVARRMTEDETAEMLAYIQAEDLDRLDFLGAARYRLTPLPDAKIDGRDAAGVLVQRTAGGRPVKLYFDKQTGLLVQREHLMRDNATGKQIAQATVFRGHSADANGINCYRSVTVYRDGSRILDAIVVRLSYDEGERRRRSYPDVGDFPPVAPDQALGGPSSEHVN